MFGKNIPRIASMTGDPMQSDHTAIDASICPLCDAPNHCTMAGCNKKSNAPCWCKTEQFPQELLDQVPEDRKNRTCICSKCLQSFTKKDAVSEVRKVELKLI